VTFVDPPVRITQEETLFIDIPASVSTNAEAGVASFGRYTLAVGGKVDVEVVAATTSATGHTETYLAVRQDYLNGYLIDVNTTSIEFISRVGGAGPPLRRPYDVLLHRFWRIEHGPATNEVTFWTSPDGASWFMQSQQTSGVPFTNLEIVLAAGTFWGGDPAPTQAQFDNFVMCGASPE
jgi:hypothetical protein